eukprot:5311411-Pleurochrysis_carterae.AAC.1
MCRACKRVARREAQASERRRGVPCVLPPAPPARAAPHWSSRSARQAAAAPAAASCAGLQRRKRQP